MALWDENKHARFHGKFSAMGINRQTLKEKFGVHIGEEAKSPFSGKIGSNVYRDGVKAKHAQGGAGHIGAIVHERGDRYSAHVHGLGGDSIEPLSDQHFGSRTEAAAALAEHWSENGHGEPVVGATMDEPLGAHPGEPGFPGGTRQPTTQERELAGKATPQERGRSGAQAELDRAKRRHAKAKSPADKMAAKDAINQAAARVRQANAKLNKPLSGKKGTRPKA